MRPIRSTMLIKHNLRYHHKHGNSARHHNKNTMNAEKEPTPIMSLLTQKPVVVNVGLEAFAEDLDSQQVSVVHLDWRPPAGGDAELADLLSRLGS